MKNRFMQSIFLRKISESLSRIIDICLIRISLIYVFMLSILIFSNG